MYREAAATPKRASEIEITNRFLSMFRIGLGPTNIMETIVAAEPNTINAFEHSNLSTSTTQ